MLNYAKMDQIMLRIMLDAKRVFIMLESTIRLTLATVARISVFAFKRFIV